MKIVAEDKQIENRSTEFLGDWEKSKPVDGTVRPGDALQKIQLYEASRTLKHRRLFINRIYGVS